MRERKIWELIGRALTVGELDPYLDKLYGKHPGYDYYRFCYFLAQAMKPAIIVELGTQYGYCLCHFAAGAPKARVISIDTDDCTRHDWFAHDFKEHYPNAELQRGRSEEQSTADRFEDGSVGIVFLDTTHTYQQVLAEVKVWTPKIAPGGVLLIDDLREMPDLLPMLPFERKAIVMGLHTNPHTYPDQRFAYALP